MQGAQGQIFQGAQGQLMQGAQGQLMQGIRGQNMMQPGQGMMVGSMPQGQQVQLLPRPGQIVFQSGQNCIRFQPGTVPRQQEALHSSDNSINPENASSAVTGNQFNQGTPHQTGVNPSLVYQSQPQNDSQNPVGNAGAVVPVTVAGAKKRRSTAGQPRSSKKKKKGDQADGIVVEPALKYYCEWAGCERFVSMEIYFIYF